MVLKGEREKKRDKFFERYDFIEGEVNFLGGICLGTIKDLKESFIAMEGVNIELVFLMLFCYLNYENNRIIYKLSTFIFP